MKPSKKNAVKNKARKQAEARAKLMFAREHQGSVFVAVEVFTGNSYVRNVVQGSHLAPGVESFELTEEEAEDLRVMNEAYEVVQPSKRPETGAEVMDMLKRHDDAIEFANKVRREFRKLILGTA